MRKQIREGLLKEQKRKKNQLIERKLIESRILFIIESKEKFESLSESKKRKVFFQLVEEINTLEENGLITEMFEEILKNIFGNAFSGVAQSFVEPMINSVLGAFGLGGFFKDFMTSFIVSRPDRIARAFKSCDELTKLIAESLSEALFIMVQRQQGLEGKGYSIIRNTLGGAIKDTTFIKNLEQNIADTVCGVFNKHSNKAENVLDKLKDKGKEVVSNVTKTGQETLSTLKAA